MIPDGAGKHYGAVLVWCLVRFGYATFAELRAAQAAYPYPRISGGKLPPLLESVTEGKIETVKIEGQIETVQLRMPKSSARLSNMNAAQVLVWMQHSVEVFRPFIERKGGAPPAWWEAWVLYVRILHMLMARQVGHQWAQHAALLIRRHHELVISIREFGELFKKKDHYLDHIPLDGLSYGPPVQNWLFLFEAFHQPFKQAARACNFKDALWTIALSWAETSAMDFFNQTHVGRSLESSTREPFQRVEADACTCASRPRLRAVLQAAGLSPSSSPEVELYHDVVFMGRIIERGRAEVPSGGWVQFTFRPSAGAPVVYTERLAYVVDIYYIGEQFFLVVDVYPPSSLSCDVATGELTSSDLRVVASRRVQGGRGVDQGVVLKVTREELQVWPLTRLTADASFCRFVAKA